MRFEKQIIMTHQDIQQNLKKHNFGLQNKANKLIKTKTLLKQKTVLR